MASIFVTRSKAVLGWSGVRLLLFAGLLLAGACAPAREGRLLSSSSRAASSVRAAPLQAHVVLPPAFLQLHSVRVLPVQFEKRDSGVSAEIAARMNRELGSALRGELDIAVYGPGGHTAEVEARSGSAAGDFVLTTVVHTYTERDGGVAGAEAPAVVDFSMSLGRSGTEVWRASYHFVDHPLTENLFRLENRLGKRGGATFRRAEELLVEGFHEAGRHLAATRMAQFSAQGSLPRGFSTGAPSSLGS